MAKDVAFLIGRDRFELDVAKVLRKRWVVLFTGENSYLPT